MSAPSPFATGLSGRCPNCGEGALFDGYLKIADACDVCETSFENADVGDGAAVFVMFITGFLTVIPVLLVHIAFEPPLWVDFLVGAPLVIIFTLGLLRPAKGLLYALQFKHDAQEARLDE